MSYNVSKHQLVPSSSSFTSVLPSDNLMLERTVSSKKTWKALSTITTFLSSFVINSGMREASSDIASIPIDGTYLPAVSVSMAPWPPGASSRRFTTK